MLVAGKRSRILRIKIKRLAMAIVSLMGSRDTAAALCRNKTTFYSTAVLAAEPKRDLENRTTIQ
jgi:hypothetical protein